MVSLGLSFPRVLPAPQDSGVGLGTLRELPIPFVCSTSVCLEGVECLPEWGCPEEQREPPGCLQWGVGGSQPVREGAWLEAAQGWGAQWGEGLEMCLVLSWSKVAFEEGMKYTSALDWYSTAPEF